MTIPIINEGSFPLATKNGDPFTNIVGGNLAQKSQITNYNPNAVAITGGTIAGTSVTDYSSKANSVLVAALGDSITAYASLGGVNINVLSYQPIGFLTWAMAFSMRRAWCPLVGTPNSGTALVNYNRGVSGETAEQVLARVPELDTLSVKPQYCSVLAGTNNLTINTTQTATQITAVIIQICQALLRRGIRPVLCTLLPRGSGSAAGWNALSAGQITTARGRLLEINRQLRTYAASNPAVRLADTFYSILDFSSATSDPVAALTGGASATPDYIHPNIPGAQLVGAVWWQAIASDFGVTQRQAAGTGDTWSATDNNFGSMWDSTFATNGGTAGTGVSAAPSWVTATATAKNAVIVSGGNLYKAAVAGTTGTVAPTHTTGQAIDGTVVWEYVSSTALAGVAAGWTSGRLAGAAVTAAAAVSARADGLLGNEFTLSINPGADAIGTTLSYPTSGGGVLPNGNFTAGDAIYIEDEVTVDCGSALGYAIPNTQLQISTSAYAGAYQLYTALGTNAITSHFAGKLTAVFRSPILDTGVGISGITGAIAVAGARTGGSGAVIVTRRDVGIRKYNKTAIGAISW